MNFIAIDASIARLQHRAETPLGRFLRRRQEHDAAIVIREMACGLRAYTKHVKTSTMKGGDLRSDKSDLAHREISLPYVSILGSRA